MGDMTIAAAPVCTHTPACPPANHPGHLAAAVIRHDYGLGCSFLCNGVVVFDDGGELSPDNRPVPAQRGPAPHNLLAVPAGSA